LEEEGEVKRRNRSQKKKKMVVCGGVLNEMDL